MLRLAAARVATPMRSTRTAQQQAAAAQCTSTWLRPATRGTWTALQPLSLPSAAAAVPRLVLLPRRCSSSSASPLASTRPTPGHPAAHLTPSPPVTSSSPSSSPSDPDPSADGPLVRRLNHAIAVMPLETIGSLILLEGTSFWLTRLVFNATGVTFPALFAVAFVLSMPLRRAALPKLCVALPLSWLLARVAPSLTRVHLTRLAQGWRQGAPVWMTKLFRSRSSGPVADAPAADGASSSAAPSPRFVPAVAPAASAIAQRLTALSDRYGLALLISYRMAGFVIINGVYLALKHGVDIQPLLQLLGLSVDVHAKSVVASYAAAVATSALWFPFMVFLAPWPAQLFYSIRKRFSSSQPADATADAVATTTAMAATTTTAPAPAAATAATPAASSAPPAGAPADSTGGRASSGEGKPSADSSTKATSLVLLALFGSAAANAADDDSATTASSSPSTAVNVVFRRASGADLAAIVRLLGDDALGSTRESVPTGADARVDPVYAAAFAAIDSDPNHELVVGVCGDSGAVVACMQLSFLPNLTLRASTRAQIEGVRVRADMRGRNIGRAMFCFAEQRARQRGCALLQLTTNTQRPDAAKFYTQLGYVASHIGFKKSLV